MRRYDSAKYLETDLMIANYIKVALQTGEIEQILNSLSNAMRARAINQLIKETEIDRDTVYRLFMNESDIGVFPVIKNQDAVLRAIHALLDDCAKSQAPQRLDTHDFNRWYRHPLIWFLVGSLFVILAYAALG